MTCAWTLRDATPARLPDLSPEDSIRLVRAASRCD